MSTKKQLKIIACLSQKGGVVKSGITSTLSEFLSRNHQVLVADMDKKQASSYEWALFRQANNLKPEVDVAKFNSFQAVAKSINPSKIDYLIVDGAANDEEQSLLIGVNSNLVIIPTGVSVTDLNPQIRFSSKLEDAGLSPKNIIFVFTKTGTSKKEIEEAHGYLKRKTSCKVAKNNIPYKTCFSQAGREGRSFGEVTFPSLRKKIDMLMCEIMQMLK